MSDTTTPIPVPIAEPNSWDFKHAFMSLLILFCCAMIGYCAIWGNPLQAAVSQTTITSCAAILATITTGYLVTTVWSMKK